MAIQKNACARHYELIESGGKERRTTKGDRRSDTIRSNGIYEQDRYLLEINLEDLETSTGEDQYYWLIAIRAARAD